MINQNKWRQLLIRLISQSLSLAKSFFFRKKSSLLSLTGELVIDWLVAAGNAESTLIYGIRKDRHVPNELLFLVNETEDLEKKKSLTSSN